MLSAQGGIESAECLPHGAILLHIQEVAGSRTHLTLRFLYEEGFCGADDGRALLRTDDFNVAGDEGVVGGGGDNGIHNGKVFIVKLSANVLVSEVSCNGVVRGLRNNDVLAGILHTLLGFCRPLRFTEVQGRCIGESILGAGKTHIHDMLDALDVINHPTISIGLGEVDVGVDVVIVHIVNHYGFIPNFQCKVRDKILIMQGFTHNNCIFLTFFRGLSLISLFLSQTKDKMALRIKELCKEKHITMKDIADKIGINHITLSQSLNGNPTLSRLQEVADILGVDVAELFEHPVKDTIFGCLYVNGKPCIVNNREDISSLLNNLE